MKVTDVERITVNVPYTPRQQIITRQSVYNWTILELCKVTTDTGHIGWGETVIHYTYGRVSDESVSRVIGRSPGDLMNEDGLGAGLQMALFDVVGKILEVPAHKLLGTKVRDWTPISWWCSHSSAANWAAEAAEAYEKGYTNLKNKPRPWEDIVAQVEAICKAVPPHFHLDLDPNGSWENAGNAIPIIKKLEAYDNVAIFETPIPQSDILGNRQIRRAIDRPVAMHFGSPPFATCVREEVCDGFVIGGGASTVRHQGECAAGAEMPFWLQIVGNGLTTTWDAHLGAVLTHARWPTISCINMYSHHLLTEPVQVINGHQRVPDGPGLGVEVDEEAVERFRVPQEVLDEHAARGELFIHPQPRLINATIYPDKTCIYSYSLSAPGTYVEGVHTKIIDDDGSEEWNELFERVQREGQVVSRVEGRSWLW